MSALQNYLTYPFFPNTAPHINKLGQIHGERSSSGYCCRNTVLIILEKIWLARIPDFDQKYDFYLKIHNWYNLTI